jgi:hypothetical protein
MVGPFEFVLKGRGFSRAGNDSKSIPALAAAGRVFQTAPLPLVQSEHGIDTRKAHTRHRRFVSTAAIFLHFFDNWIAMPV